MFQSLARERLEQLNASPSATPSKYFRVYSALLLVLSADVLWIKLCVGFCKSCNSQLFWLMFFEPLSIGFETLQVLQPRLWEVSPPYLFLIYNDLALSKKSALHLMFKGGGAYKCQLEMLKIL
jgi:hypothetical protein